MGKTIAQVSAELRIAHRYLAGIEKGEFGDFPERVFSTGFIRSYAKYLSQDPGPVLADYERSIGIRDDSEMAAKLRFGWVERDRERGSRRATYTLAAGAVLLVGVILAWVTLRTEHRPLPPPSPPPAVVLPSPPAVENAAKAGDKISIHATRRITLKLGNAGGVAGTLNGRRLPPFGERGQVRKFTFGQ